MDKIRVLIVDDHAIVRMGMVALVNAQPNMEVVGEAKNGRQAVELADSLRPDVVNRSEAVALALRKQILHT